MYRIFLWVGLCLLCAASATVAGTVLVNTTTKDQQVLVNASIKDGDLAEVLATLCNQSGYQVRIGAGVTGAIASLQFTREPFESALRKILAGAGENFTFTKLGEGSYRVEGGAGGDVKVPTFKPAVDTHAKPDDLKIIKVMLPPVKKTTATGTTTPGTTAPLTATTTTVAPFGGGVTGTTTTTGATEGTEAAKAEEAYIALITVYNLDLWNLCNSFGSDIAQFIPPQVTSYNNNNNNGYNNNNNGYNNGYYNNGYNNGYYDNGYNNGYNNNGYNNNNGYYNNNNNSRYNNNRYNNNNNNGYNNNNNGYYNNNNGYYNNNYR